MHNVISNTVVSFQCHMTQKMLSLFELCDNYISPYGCIPTLHRVSKKCHPLLTITLCNLGRFSQFLTAGKPVKFSTKWCITSKICSCTTSRKWNAQLLCILCFTEKHTSYMSTDFDNFWCIKLQDF